MIGPILNGSEADQLRKVTDWSTSNRASGCIVGKKAPLHALMCIYISLQWFANIITHTHTHESRYVYTLYTCYMILFRHRCMCFYIFIYSQSNRHIREHKYIYIYIIDILYIVRYAYCVCKCLHVKNTHTHTDILYDTLVLPTHFTNIFMRSILYI